MTPRRRRRWTRRRKVALAVVVAGLGVALLTWGAVRLAAVRDTDQADPAAGLTARARASTGAVLPAIHFREVAAEAGIAVVTTPGARGRTLPEDTGAGLAFGDYDGDGDPDLYVVGFPGAFTLEALSTEAAGGGHGRLYRNDGGRFEDVTERAGVANAGRFGMGARFADFDADGLLDLYITNFGANRLYRNQGDGTFADVAEAAGVTAPGWSTGATFGDFDRDGRLDLYVCGYVDYDLDGRSVARVDAGGGYRVPLSLNPNSFDPVRNHLFRNRGDGTFEDVTDDAGVRNQDGRSLAASFCDLDDDGWLDLYVNNDVSPNRLYRNVGALGSPVRFVDVSTLSGTADPRGSMGLSIAELGELGHGGDGLPDLFIAHWVAQENALYQSLAAPGGRIEYRDKTRQLGLGELSLDTVGWGTAFADLDLDGRLDLLVANGSTLEQKADPSRLRPEPLFVLYNTGSRFEEIAAHCGPGVRGPHQARGLAVADIDADGDLDVAVAINRGRPRLFRNDTVTKNLGLRIRLGGPPAARFGARVTVHVEGRSMRQWYGADASFLSDHDKTLVFGLGQASSATSVHVRFADGREVERSGVPAGVLELAPGD